MSSPSIPLKLVPLETDGYHLLVQVKVNAKNALMVLDTGASSTVFDTKRIRTFIGNKKIKKDEKLATGLGTNSMQSHRVVVTKMKIGSKILNEIPVILIDLSNVNKAYRQMGHKQIDGIIGCDILVRFNAVIDVGNKKLQLKEKK